MADWTDITRNLKAHGHFAGRSETEQDAYFEFIAGPDREFGRKIRIEVPKALSQVIEQFYSCSFRWVLSGLSSIGVTNKQ
ncbi:MAG: hypothetical protein AB8B94_17665 [Hyphomicrobiales bacterium]